MAIGLEGDGKLTLTDGGSLQVVEAARFKPDVTMCPSLKRSTVVTLHRCWVKS